MFTINRKLAALFASACLFYSGAFAYTAFNNNISEDELKILDEGKNLIVSKNYKNICLKNNNPASERLISEVSSLKPAYFAEIIQVYPYEGNEDFPSRFRELILDVESYVGIPYYSERVEKWFDLYSSAETISKEETENGEHVKADLFMKPFGLINTDIVTEEGEDWFFYKSTNLSLMRYYDKFDCIKPLNMKSMIIVFRDNDKWIMYGVGAVKAPSIFFLKERVETSFMNRIKTFCAFFCTKFKEEDNENL